MKNFIVCDVTPSSQLQDNRFYERTELESLAICFMLVSCLAQSSTLDLEDMILDDAG
jgi:hypothetical protein